MTSDTVKAELVERIHLRLEQLAERPLGEDDLPPDVYAEKVLDQLRSEFPNPIALRILETFSAYLKYLADSERDPLRDLCEAAIQASVISYRHHGIPVPEDIPGLRVSISTDWREEPRQSTFPNPFLGLAWVENDCQSQCCRDVKAELRDHIQTLHLTLSPKRFYADTLASLPFVLFHECVSHVLQGPWARARRAPDFNSQFAEGWMDRTALAVFEDALTGRAPCDQVQLIPYRHKHNFFRYASQRLYQERHNDNVPYEHRLAASSRMRGVDAAELIIQMFGRLGVSNPLEPFLRLSFALNASDTRPGERDIFVEFLHEGLGSDAAASKEAELASALRMFASNGDIHTLLSYVT